MHASCVSVTVAYLSQIESSHKLTGPRNAHFASLSWGFHFILNFDY